MRGAVLRAARLDQVVIRGDVVQAAGHEQALDDAEFYGARQRKIQIGTLLPIVAAEKLNYIEREKTRFLIYLASIAALALLVIWFSVMLSKQLKKLKIKEKIIDDKMCSSKK